MNACSSTLSGKKPDPSLVQAALRSLLSSHERAAGAADGAVAAAAPSAGQLHPTSTWRARRIVREINALSSPEGLVSYEAEMRAVLLSQETRQWVKLTARTLYDECNTEEIAVLVDREAAARAEMVRAAAVSIVPLVRISALMVEEEKARMAIRIHHRDTIRFLRTVFQRMALAAEEFRCRRFIKEAEAVSRTETFQRRLIDVGRELQLELMRRNACDLFAATRRSMTRFSRGAASVFQAEEKDRFALEKLSFLHLSVLYNSFQTELFPALRRDVLAGSVARATTDRAVVASVVLPKALQDCEHSEARIRQMVLQAEEDEFRTMHYQFVVGWRGVYERITAETEIVQLVSSLELFERRQVHDEERRARTDLFRVAETAITAATRRRQELVEFLRLFAEGAGAIWREETAAFGQLHHLHHQLTCVAKAISFQRVLSSEEERGRVGIRGQEARMIAAIQRQARYERCYVDAQDGARGIATLESMAFARLSAWHALRSATFPAAAIIAAEADDRFVIEAEEDMASVDLLHEKERLMHGADMLSRSEQLVRHERHWREVVVAQQANAARGLAVAQVLSMEKAKRDEVRHQEIEERHPLSMRSLSLNETATRHCVLIRQHRDQVMADMALQELVGREGVLRGRLETIEAERRRFFTESPVFQQPLLLACQAEEITQRLDIMAEAELTTRACAYGAQHDAPIQYITEDLRAEQRRLRYFSVREVFACVANELVVAVEPSARLALEQARHWQALIIKLHMEEAVCRQRLSEEALSRVGMLLRHSAESAALLQRCAPPPVTGDELRDDAYEGSLWSEDRIMRYLRSVESNVGVAGPTPRLLPMDVRDALAVLFSKAFMARDRISFQEFAERRALHNAAARGPVSPTDACLSPTVELHSALMLSVPVLGDPAACDSSAGLPAPPEPAVVSATMLRSAEDDDGYEEGDEEDDDTPPRHFCSALTMERAMVVGSGALSSANRSTTVTVFSTSAVDRRWSVDHRALLTTPLAVEVLDYSGNVLAQTEYCVTPEDVFEGCLVLDISADYPMRLKFLLNV